MKKKIIISFALGLMVLGIAWSVSAVSVFDIEFPIPELGSCADKQACKTYCDEPANKDACLSFAEKYGLADKKSVEQARNIPEVGPGGCRGEGECRNYCDDAAHAEECVVFGEKHGLVSREEVEKFEDFKKQSGPGGCQGANECRNYCEDPAHTEECIAFAKKKGLISERDAEVATKVSKTGGPGGCRNEKDCRVYCEDPANIEQCMSFAEEHGFVTSEQAQRIKKAGLAGGPGGCRGQDQCRQYCEEPVHQQECIDFAEKNGFMSSEEASRARKMAGRSGPGGCVGKQCENFCNDSANSEVCLEFAEKEGLMPKEELEKAKKFLKASKEGGPGGCVGRQCQEYCQGPAHEDECFEFAKKQGLLDPEAEQSFEAGRKLRQVMQQAGGPGGCRTEDECSNYCVDPAHVEECIAFGAAHGGVSEEKVKEMLKGFSERRFEVRSDFTPRDFKDLEQGAFRRFEEFRQLEKEFRGRVQIPGGFPGTGEFRGKPGEFPGGPGGASDFGGSQGTGGGFGGFVGPGGCSSPTECIKYCTEHREECFGGTENQGPLNNGECCPPPGDPTRGGGFPTIRRDIVREFNQNELPPGFEQLPEEKRQEIFRQKFEEFRGGSPAGFPGGGFPGGEQGFPSGQFPGQGATGGQFPGGQGSMPQEMFNRNFEGEYQKQFQQRFQEQQKEFPEGFQRQPFENIRPIEGTPGILGPVERFEPRSGFEGQQGTIPGTNTNFQPIPKEQFVPPTGGEFKPETGSFPPPGSFTPPPSAPTGTFESVPPPPTGTFTQPSTSGGTFESSPPPPPSGGASPPPPPTSVAPRSSFFATLSEMFNLGR